jgi:hypothetical protein
MMTSIPVLWDCLNDTVYSNGTLNYVGMAIC